MTLPRPRRLIQPSPPGSLLKQPFAAKVARRADGSDQDADYLAMVRQCPCLCCGSDPCGEAAHVRFSSAAFGKSSGMQKKPADRWVLPLCGDDHRLARHAQHRQNEEAFWYNLGINALVTCERLYAKRDDLVAMRAVCFVVISERTLSRPDHGDGK